MRYRRTKAKIAPGVATQAGAVGGRHDLIVRRTSQSALWSAAGLNLA